jgi:hypothetical protein
LNGVSWEHLSDEELLEVRICDLGVQIRGSEIEPRVRRLYDELRTLGLNLRPLCYLSDEWLSPGGEAAIGIPFYLAHPRLKALEARMMAEVEGGTTGSCMKLLRHEAAHALDHAYALHRRGDWQEVFGSPRKRYSPYFYPFDPHSKAHVRNIPENYAQCHPEEDWAETFAVWLNPASRWRTRYRGWPAMRKLRYVQRVTREIAQLPVPRRQPVPDGDISGLRSTLANHYRRKLRLYRVEDLSFAQRDLKKIFRAGPAQEPAGRASSLIRRHKRVLVEAIAEWSGERASRASRVVTRLAKLCDEHELALRADPQASLVKLSTYAATLIANRVHTSRYRSNRMQ